MKINVCVNGTFRYNQYIRYYDERRVLNRFSFAHRISTTKEIVGVKYASVQNVWYKEYLLHLALGVPGLGKRPQTYTDVCELWQSAVLRNWTPCDSIEVVTGAMADRVLKRAKAEGIRTIGHPVTSHPEFLSEAVEQERRRLGLEPLPGSRALLERKSNELDLCDHLIVDSSFVRRTFLERGFSPDRVTVVTPGNDARRFSPRQAGDVDAETFRVVCVGLISARKGQRYLLEAWRRLNLPRSELVLIGHLSPDAANVIAGHEGDFTHLPSVPNEKLRDILKTASAFVLPSIEDGWAQSPMEAMSCGVPTIVTSQMGVADIVEDGVTGFVVEPGNAAAIAEKLDILHRDKSLAHDMGRRGAERTALASSWKDYVDRVIEVHRGAAST